MLAGSTGGGKTVIINTLIKAQCHLGQATKCTVINPKVRIYSPFANQQYDQRRKKRRRLQRRRVTTKHKLSRMPLEQGEKVESREIKISK